MRLSPIVRARSWAIWPLVFFFRMLALHLGREENGGWTEERGHLDLKAWFFPDTEVSLGASWPHLPKPVPKRPPWPLFLRVALKRVRHLRGFLISNVQFLILAIGHHCIKVLWPTTFTEGNIFILHKVKGVHHHQTLIIWNVKGTYLRKRRRSKIWTVKWQQTHNYQQPILKKKKKWTKLKTRTGTESQKWRSHGRLSARSGMGRVGEKVQGIWSINGR